MRREPQFESLKDFINRLTGKNNVPESFDEPVKKSREVAYVNDQFRKTFDPRLGRVVFTGGMSDSPSEVFHSVIREVKNFTDFTEDNDPYGEHDFGSVEIDGEKYFWKIDYYDTSYQYGSKDYVDLNKTRRVLTIMHETEY
jgi:hypothetical protein